MRNRWTLARRPLAAALLLVPVVTTACGRSDADTAAAVREQLQKDSVTAPLELSVTVAGGVATLSGTVYAADEQARAIEIARAVVGVSEVVDDTTIDEDALLASTVKSALTADPALADVPIEVDARNGYVRLISDATNAEQRDRAREIAGAVDGVTDVEDRMK